ncbi:MAG: hypothetical protein ACE5HL_08120 [Terriglobia bacterium]
MRAQSIRCLALFLLLTAAVPPTGAREPAPELLPDTLRKTPQPVPAETRRNDWNRLQNLPAGTELRVSLERARVFKGKLVSVTDDALTLRATWEGRKTLSASQIVRIHRLHRDSVLDGTLIGLGVGAAAGAILGAAPEPGELTRVGAALFLGVIGAGIGAATGAAVDYHRVELQLIYEKLPENAAPHQEEPERRGRMPLEPTPVEKRGNP